MFDTLMAPIWYALVVVASIVALTLAGCSSDSTGLFDRTIAGTAVPEGKPTVEFNDPATAEPVQADSPRTATEIAPGLPTMAGYEDRPEVYRVMRMVDPCALHSPKDAARISQLIPDEIMPGHSLNICKLELIKTVYDLPLWTLTTTVGVDFGETIRSRAQQQDINGAPFWFLPPVSVDAEDCTYIKEFGPATGIELRVAKRDDSDRRDPCQIARDYLLAVGKWWVNPAIRADKVTSPYLPVAAANPCDAIAKVAADLDQPMQASLSNPHSCGLQPTESGTKGSFGALLVVDFQVETDPLAVLKSASSSRYTSVTVSGKPGTSTQLKMPSINGHERVTCYVTVVVDDQLALQADQARPDTPRSYQVVTTRSPDCELAKRGAEAALATIP